MRYLVLMILFVISLIASELKIEHNFTTAIQKAKKQNKEVMMIYSAVWCPECEYMKEIVLKDKEIVNYIQKRYIVLILDIQKDKLPEQYKYIGIPTFFFIDKNEKETNKIIGGDKASKFLKKLKDL
jgi:thiol:disulfide interchange protein